MGVGGEWCAGAAGPTRRLGGWVSGAGSGAFATTPPGPLQAPPAARSRPVTPGERDSCLPCLFGWRLKFRLSRPLPSGDFTAVRGFCRIFPWGLVSMCTGLGGHLAGLPPRLAPTTKGDAELEARDPSRSDLPATPTPAVPLRGRRDPGARGRRRTTPLAKVILSVPSPHSGLHGAPWKRETNMCV